MEETFSLLGETGLAVHGKVIRPKMRGSFPLAVIAGDLFDTTTTPFVKELSKQLLDAGFALAAFDFTNSLGVSDGRVSDVTLSQRARDLEIVVECAKGKKYIQEKKVLVIGLGFGGTAALALEGFKPLARAMVLVNTPVMVEDTAWTRFPEREMLRVRLKRYFHILREGHEERINCTFFEDASRIDLARCARNLTTPTLLLVGGKASVVGASHAQWLNERLVAAKHELLVLPELGDASERREAKLVLNATLDFAKRMKLF
jgi:pimeloyl-ACP methyl ester carboxylesterase